MTGPPLPIGTWGEIATWAVQTDDKGKAVKHKSQARFRDHDGHVRPVSAYGKTKTAVERARLKKLQDRAKTGKHTGELTAMHEMNVLIDLFEAKFKNWVKDGKRSPTLDNYEGAIKNHIRPALGELRIGEATTPRIDTAVAQIKQRMPSYGAWIRSTMRAADSCCWPIPSRSAIRCCCGVRRPCSVSHRRPPMTR